MKLLKKIVQTDPDTFIPEVVLTIAFPLEIPRELNGLYVLDMEEEYACLISKEIVKYLKE